MIEPAKLAKLVLAWSILSLLHAGQVEWRFPAELSWTPGPMEWTRLTQSPSQAKFRHEPDTRHWRDETMNTPQRTGAAAILAASTLMASQAVPQPAPANGTEAFRDAEAGFSMRLAGGFRFLSRQGSITLFGSNTTPGVVLVEGGETFTAEELSEAARSGYQTTGVALLPDGPYRKIAAGFGEGLAFPVKGTLDGQTVRGMLAGIRTRTGRCFIVLAATTPEGWPKLAEAAERMIGGVELFAPDTPAVDPQLKSYFAGMRFSFYMSRPSVSSSGSFEGSFSGQERIYLCSDGSFQYGEQTRGTFDVPQAMGSARTNSNGSGRWQVSGADGGALLTLIFNDGRRSNYRATRLGRDLVYLNGSKYFRAGQDRCK